MSTLEQTYNYVISSALTRSGDAAELSLATSGGSTQQGSAAHPEFFRGFLNHPEQSAQAMLAVAKVARTRFYVPPGMLARILRSADPVVTCSGDRLRFESFSLCCGVAARFDALEGSVDGEVLNRGTTNVDFNPPMRDALAQVRGSEPLHLAVGADVTVRTMEAAVTEPPVPLPQRWLKGFAEVQIAGADMQLKFDVPAAQARSFLNALPAGHSRLVVMQSARGLRLTTRQQPGTVAVGGIERLKPLLPLVRFAQRLRVYSSEDAGASIWELELADARIALTLSPEPSRGFSGEGKLLTALSDPQAQRDAEMLCSWLSFQTRLDVTQLAHDTLLSESRVVNALNRLGAAGRVGFDVAEGSYFHRELPYDATALEAMHPRLLDAQNLIDQGAVSWRDGFAFVNSKDHSYRVRFAQEGSRCTCEWAGKYGTSRGPCKHILAAGLSRPDATET